MKSVWLDCHRSDVVDCHGFEAAAAIFVSQPRTKVLSEDISPTRRDDISSQKQFEDQPLFAQLLFPLCRDISSMCQLVDSPTVFKCNSPRRKKGKRTDYRLAGWVHFHWFYVRLLSRVEKNFLWRVAKWFLSLLPSS